MLIRRKRLITFMQPITRKLANARECIPNYPSSDSPESLIPCPSLHHDDFYPSLPSYLPGQTFAYIACIEDLWKKRFDRDPDRGGKYLFSRGMFSRERQSLSTCLLLSARSFLSFSTIRLIIRNFVSSKLTRIT